MKYNAENDEQNKYASLKSTPQKLSPEIKKFLDALCEKTKKGGYFGTDKETFNRSCK